MQWKVIEGFEDYKVSEWGQVFSLKTFTILKTYEKKNYLGVYLYKNRKRKFMMIHRLVAMAFIENPNNYPQINHKDENSKNNIVENLEWCSAKYNANYGNHKEKIRQKMLTNNHFKGKKHSDISKEKMSLAKKGKPSKRKREIVVDGVKYESITQALTELKIDTKKLYKILKGEK